MESPKTEKPKRVKKVIVLTPGNFNWSKREFGIIAKSFEAETPELQATLIGISGQLQLIKLNILEQPLVISYLVRKGYPGITDDDLLKALQSAAITLHISSELPGETLPEFLTSLGIFTSNMPDIQWNAFWHGAFISIGAPLIQWEKLIAYSPYIYNVLVKPIIK